MFINLLKLSAEPNLCIPFLNLYMTNITPFKYQLIQATRRADHYLFFCTLLLKN